jgi:hypothetical protein
MKCGSSKVLQLRGKKSDAVVLFCSAAVKKGRKKRQHRRTVLQQHGITATQQHSSTALRQPSSTAARQHRSTVLPHHLICYGST